MVHLAKICLVTPFSSSPHARFKVMHIKEKRSIRHPHFFVNKIFWTFKMKKNHFRWIDYRQLEDPYLHLGTDDFTSSLQHIKKIRR
jgi:hypothetical protein